MVYVGDFVEESGPGTARSPSGSFDERVDLVLPAVHGVPLFVHFADVDQLLTERHQRSRWRTEPDAASARIHLQVERVERLDGIDQTVGELLFGTVGLEGAEQSIPNDEPTTVVLVQAVLVASCVYQRTVRTSSKMPWSEGGAWLPWWTLWWVGVLKSHSSGPS